MSEWQQKEFVEEYVSKIIDPETNWYEYGVNFPDLVRMIPEGSKSILDFGCGAGRYTQKLADIFEEVTGSDIEPILSIARKNHAELHLIEWNGEADIPSEIEKYDVIFSKLTLQFIENLDQLAIHFKSILNKNGVVIFSVPNPKKIREKFNLDADKVARYDDEVSNTGIKIHPFYRPQEKYIEIFTNAGFEIIEISEPSVPDKLLNVHPEYSKAPSRLNFKFK